MSGIKTKPVMRDIKMLDKTADVASHAKNAFIHTREQAEQPQQKTHDNFAEYATDKAKEGSQSVAQKAGHTVQHQGKSAVQKARREFSERGLKNRARQKTYQTGGKAAKGTAKGTVKTANKSVKTANSTAKTAIKTSRTAAKTAAKTAQVTAKTAHKAAQAARATVKAAVTTAKATAKAVVAAAKVTITAIKGLVSVIAAGGWVAVVIIALIALVAFILSSPLAIFAGGGANNTPTISDEILTLNGELTSKITQIQKDAGQVNKVVISFNGNEDYGFIDNWSDILAVFAVKTNMDSQNPMDVAVMDDQRIAQLRKVFWDMNTVSSHISDPTPSPSPTASMTPNATATAMTGRVLTINISSKYWDEMIGVYNFNDDQANMLKEMMSAKNVTFMMQLVVSSIGKPATDWSSIIDVPQGGMNIPLYFQFDFPQTVCYFDGEPKSAASSGCGAACASMVIAYLTGNTQQTPYTLFKWAYDNGQYWGSGLGHSCLSKLVSLYGINGTWIENDASKITAALQAGHPIIAEMGPGIFTTGGHYIILRGITDDGYVLVNDPGNRNRNKYAYKLSTVVQQAGATDAFMVCEKGN